MGAKKPRTKGNGRFTEAGYFGWIRSHLRRAKWAVKYDVLKEAKRKYEGPDKRQKFEYQCAECKGWFKGTEVQVDHIKPCGQLKSFKDLPKFVETLYCEMDNLRVLCKPCHLIETNKERSKK